MISNLAVYRSIATDALAAAKEAERTRRRPREDGEPGSIITPDPARTSFKHSVIAIAFVGVYIDALVWIVGTQLLGEKAFAAIEKERLEERVKRIAIVDESFLKECEHFRRVRNDLVHEKARQTFTDERVWLAQREAERAVGFLVLLEQTLPQPSRVAGPRIAG
jgi:hypothetical protein